MLICFKYEELLDKADEIRERYLDFLEADDWEGLHGLLTISEDIWSGSSASKYQEMIDTVVAVKNDRAREVVAAIPDLIEMEVSNMQEFDFELAGHVCSGFADLS